MFKQGFMFNMKAAGAIMKPNDQKTALFLAVASKEALELQIFFRLETDKEENFYFDLYCGPKKCEPYGSCSVSMSMQTPVGATGRFVIDLKNKTQSYSPRVVGELFTRDEAVVGCNEKGNEDCLMKS